VQDATPRREAMSSGPPAGPSQHTDEEEDEMGKLVVTEFVSLDGVMQAPGGEEFKYPGWSFAFDRGDDGNRFKLEETLETDALLIGRVTYESFAGAWPSREGEFADKFNTMPKYVVSSTLDSPEWNNTTVLRGNAAEEVAKLKQEVDGIVQVPGSLRLVQELLENDLVDELHLMVFPVVLGTGRRLFGETSDKSDWRLTEAKPVGPDGVLVLVYERAR
jgi:dihydrofolate reductase